MMELDPDPLLPEQHDPASDLRQAVGLLLDRKVIVYPTETFYGLVACAFDEQAVEQIAALKGRGANHPMPCIIGRPDQIGKLAASVIPEQQGLMDRFWPGPLTLIFDAVPGLCARLTGGTNAVGVRAPGHSLARMLAELAGPLVATSANRSGQAPLNDPAAIRDLFPGIRVFDVGVLPESRGSTVVDVRSRRPILIRDGDIPFSTIEKHLSTPTSRGDV